MTLWNNAHEQAWGQAWADYENAAFEGADEERIDHTRKMFQLWDQARDIEIERVEARLGVGHHLMTWCPDCQIMVFTDSISRWHTKEMHDELRDLGRRESGLQETR